MEKEDKNPFITRAYNSIKINKNQGTITKSSKEKRLFDEMNYYQELPEHLRIYFPRMTGFRDINNSYELDLEYFPSQNLGELLISGTSEVRWNNIFESLKFILEEFSKEKRTLFSTDKEDMFLKKTETEFLKLKNNFPELNSLCTSEEVIINHISYFNFDHLWNHTILQDWIKENLCKDNEGSIIHGDLSASNILCSFDRNDNCVLKFIDCRGSFGNSFGISGDPIYDYAKLLHSIYGRYELIIYDHFNLKEIKGNKVKFDFKENYMAEAEYAFSKSKMWMNLNLLKAKVAEGLIFVSMVSRHYDSKERQIIMYSTGIKILNECLTKLNGIKNKFLNEINNK